MYSYDINIFPFIMLNILAIFVVGIVYFVTKELYRIRGGNIGKIGIVAFGAVLGLSVMALYIFLNMNVMYGQDVAGPTPTILNNNIYNQVLLSPSIIIIIIFSVMIDRRLVFPLFLFQLVGLIIVGSNVDLSDSSIETAFWTKILFTTLLYLFLVIILFFVPTIEIIKKNGIRLITAFISSLIIGLILSTLYYAAVSTQITASIWFNTNSAVSLVSIQYGYFVLYAILQTVIILFIEKIYSNFNALETFSTKDDVSYYKVSLAQNKLYRMIDEQKINVGLLALFQIKSNDSNITSLVLEKLRVNTEDKYKQTFYFKVSANYYGAFFQLSDNYKLDISLKNNKLEQRTIDDELYPLTNELLKISNKEGVQIMATGSVYGIHSYSIVELIEHARFLMSPIVTRANSNQLILYDFKRVKERLNETTKVRNLPVEIETLKISFLRALSSEEIFYPAITFKQEESTLSNIILNRTLIMQDQRNTLLRFSAYQTIREFNNRQGSLIIYYSAYHLDSDEFKLKDFIKKIDRYISKDKLIIGINTSLENIGDKFIENTRLLRELGVRFALTNPESTTQEEHDKLNPEFILDTTANSNPLKIKKIKLQFKTNAILLNPNLVN